MLNINVLYVGQLFEGSTALHRKDSLAKLVRGLRAIDSTPPHLSIQQKAWQKLKKILFNNYSDFGKINARIIHFLEQEAIDLLWIDKGVTIRAATLKLAKELHPHLLSVSYSPDDMMNPQNQTGHYLASLPEYDYFVSTKSYNIEELKAKGGKQGIFVDNAFAEDLHRPVSLTEAEQKALGAKVSFIGAFEQDRYQKMYYLAENGIKIRIWGDTWRPYVGIHPNLEIIPHSMLGEQYVKVLNATEINLCFLRKVNRDLQTTRSVEIPACGAFMLAERTDEHLNLFKEGKEADFFRDREELLFKVKYYLSHPGLVKKIALNGRKRCIDSGYSNGDRLRIVLESISQNESLLHTPR